MIDDAIDDELIAWGEPRTSPAEALLADQFADLLQQWEGNPRRRPEEMGQLADSTRQLIAGVRALYRCAASAAEDTSAGTALPLPSTDTLPTVELSRLLKDTPTDSAGIPDPFPGEFRILRRAGRGAFGEVWIAEELALERTVALKTLRPCGDADTAARNLKALRQDAKALARFRHPHLVGVFGWRSNGPDHYLVLEYVAGGSFEDRLREAGGRFDWQNAARYVADVGEGLLEVHAAGIIHRDIKPANILWDPARDEALLTDFGVAAHLSGPVNIAGTPKFMAPEAFDRKISAALDVYSLAATLFCFVAAEPPFPGPEIPQLVVQSCRGLPDPDPRCRDIPEAIERLIRAGLAADAARRPSLETFIVGLRGELNRLLVDSLPGTGKQPVSLSLDVRRSDGTAVVPERRSEPRTRDMKKVPRPPERIRLHTGDRVQIEARADREGMLLVFNVGPTGNLNLLYPEAIPTAGAAANVSANRPLLIADIEMTPPIGRERLVALWSRRPLPLKPGDLLGLAEGRCGPRSYVATRDMKRIRQAIDAVDPGDWHAVVLELEQEA